MTCLEPKVTVLDAKVTGLEMKVTDLDTKLVGLDKKVGMLRPNSHLHRHWQQLQVPLSSPSLIASSIPSQASLTCLSSAHG